jgi:hypothetical protein
VAVIAHAEGVGNDCKSDFKVTGIGGEFKTYRAVTPWIAARDYLEEVFNADCGSLCSENGAKPQRITVQSPSGAIAEYEIIVKIKASVEINLVSSTGAKAEDTAGDDGPDA